MPTVAYALGMPTTTAQIVPIDRGKALKHQRNLQFRAYIGAMLAESLAEGETPESLALAIEAELPACER